MNRTVQKLGCEENVLNVTACSCRLTTESPFPVVRLSHVDLTEKRACIEILIESRKMAIKTYELMQIAFGCAIMNQARDFELLHRFEDRRISVKSDELPARHSMMDRQFRRVV
jgi:hypothetical protein